MSPHIPITPRQLHTLRQVKHLAQKQCYSATIGELAAALHISRTTAFEHVAALREKGLLEHSTGRARCLTLTPAGETLLERAQRPKTPKQKPTLQPYAAKTHSESIFLCGRVSAGYGIDAIEEKEPFSLDDVFGSRQQLFVLRVCGQSMIGAGIHDGDYIICRSAQTAENGQIVVAMLDGQNATLKRFYKDRKTARLLPANDAFEPIYSDSCQIQAVAVGIIRRF
ncbi:MAG TPA: transcriptional repressor LexA [Anaerohalosphaeraceae bacterium]|nr:repressor LexA [Phycisphaerae bacterium]HOK95961.1 transcriptional repressor LexA [Anaerohalosphaeraceae bacterium]HOL30799.1 transcriptional repressor LexA [Anaerohalosphaeraceae bacterium]HOM77336.1 transcriptional repressor LexA [Anaerohalosphaeraceae bacterium]HPC63690.1 transcriptional repressor LexA [Anaerohalosphaeraceae bacterium]